MRYIKVRELFKEKLNGYKSRNNSLFTDCPFCQGNESLQYKEHSEKFICTNCGKFGDRIELSDKIGVEIEAPKISNKKISIDSIKGRIEILEAGNNLVNVFKKLQISDSVLDEYGLIMKGNDNIISFLYMSHDGYSRGNQKFDFSGDKPKLEWISDYSSLLWNMDKTVNEDNIVLVNGIMNALSLLSKGISNVVAISDYKNIGWLEDCYDYLSTKKKIYVLLDRVVGENMSRNIFDRLGRNRTIMIDNPYNSTCDMCIANDNDILNSLRSIGEISKVDNVIPISDIPRTQSSELLSCGDAVIDGLLGGIRLHELTVISGTPGCVDCDTEFFNGFKWKKISEYKRGDKVCQYNQSKMKPEMVYPENYIKEEYDGTFRRYTDRLLDMMLTPNHNVIHFDGKMMKMKEEKFYQLLSMKNNFEPHIPIYINKEHFEEDLFENKNGVGFILDIINQNHPFLKTNISDEHKSKDGFKYCFTVPSGMLVLRRSGHIFVTGNSGKSTLLNQLIANFADNNEGSVLYSGEFRPAKLRDNIFNTFAGEGNLTVNENKYNPKIKERSISDEFVYSSIAKKYGNIIDVFDFKDEIKDEYVVKAIEETFKKRGKRIFVIDNLMTVGLNDKIDKYEAQTNFVKKLTSLKNDYPIHIFLVAHPKKIDNIADATGYDIAGTSNIFNLIDNMILLRRLDKHKDKKELEYLKGLDEKSKRTIIKDPSVALKLLKDREHGRLNSKAYMSFHPETGRMHDRFTDPRWKYKWQK